MKRIYKVGVLSQLVEDVIITINTITSLFPTVIFMSLVAVSQVLLWTTAWNLMQAINQLSVTTINKKKAIRPTLLKNLNLFGLRLFMKGNEVA